jgi:hypothetical protein
VAVGLAARGVRGFFEEVVLLVAGNRLRAQPKSGENRRWAVGGDWTDRGRRDAEDGIGLSCDCEGYFTE